MAFCTIDATPGPSKLTNLSFCGCGFLGMYHLGVAKCLAKNGTLFLNDVQKYGGASAGALIATALATRGADLETLDECLELCRLLGKTVYDKRLGVLTPRLCLLTPIKEFLRQMLPDNAYSIASGRLYVAVTKLVGMKCVIVSEFESNEHLIQCLVASCYVPFVTGARAIKIGGQRFIDGGARNNLPIIPGARTILVSPFSGKQQICPKEKWLLKKSRFVTINKQNFLVHHNNLIRGLHAFFPPNPIDLDEYYEQGLRDAEKFLKRENLFSSSPSAKPRDQTPDQNGGPPSPVLPSQQGSGDRPSSPSNSAIDYVVSPAAVVIVQKETTI